MAWRGVAAEGARFSLPGLSTHTHAHTITHTFTGESLPPLSRLHLLPVSFTHFHLLFLFLFLLFFPSRGGAGEMREYECECVKNGVSYRALKSESNLPISILIQRTLIFSD